MENTFTVADGIATQTAQLKQWKSILKYDVYEKIEKQATANNHKAKTGYDICRGCDILNLVMNIRPNA
jgi:hypothetical protein